MCEPGPYFGQFCDLCSGSPICLDDSCEANLDCADCILDVLTPFLNNTSVEEFFNASANLTAEFFPGSMLSVSTANNALELALPRGYCSVCDSGAVVINMTDRVDNYQIDGKPYVSPKLGQN